MINHLHVHIIPRRKNDFKNNDDIYPLIEKFDEKYYSPSFNHIFIAF